MRITNTGIVLTIIYITTLVVCAIWAQFVSDPKGQYVILQLPVSLQHAVLLFVGATNLLSGMSWPVIYVVLGIPMIVMLILLGYLIELFLSQFFSGDKFRDKARKKTC